VGGSSASKISVANIVAVPLPDGRWLALPTEELAAALDRAAGLGLRANAFPAPLVVAGHTAERWLDSRELAELTGIHDTTLEGWAKSGAIPCLRAGKALRFKASEVEAALRSRTS
jgi:excisionase family DNA binding protein